MDRFGKYLVLAMVHYVVFFLSKKFIMLFDLSDDDIVEPNLNQIKLNTCRSGKVNKVIHHKIPKPIAWLE